MAEGGEVSGRRNDVIQNCSPCSNKGTEKAATKYCFKCETSFCQDCTEQHNALLSNHRVTDIETANVGVPVTFNAEPCPEHGEALTVTLYCKKCFFREQQSCKELIHLPSSAQEASAPAQVKKKYKIDVKVKADRSTCNILGSCVLQDGSILLADYNNKMLKCVDQNSLKVTDQCPMQDSPYDVCVINNNEVAVTQQNKTVVIVSVRPRLTPTRTISMNHPCEGVAYSQGKLFITDCGKSLYIYNMEGSLLRKVSTDPSGQDIFSETRHITVSGAADKVYIADYDKGVIVLDREGQVQEKMVIDKIRDTFGLCLDGMGGLFVCGVYSKNVVHVAADGQILTEVLTTSDGLGIPLSVCYDRLHKRLIVTQDVSNQIHVCEFE